MSAELFKKFRENISVKNADKISASYCEITKCLNKYYYESESETDHSRQVGSYGRQTAIHGISDLDMAFELPKATYDRFNAYDGNGQSALLQEVKRVLQDHYSSAKAVKIKADGQVIIIPFKGYEVEVLPAFVDVNDNYIYADTNKGGSWKTTKPRKEIDAVNSLNKNKNRNLKRLSKMVRSWKNKHGVNMGGLLIDTLCYNFLNNTTEYDAKSYGSYKTMVRDFFGYLNEQRKGQTEWRAPGSNQVVHKKGHFHRKAKVALDHCESALLDEEKSYKYWRKVFGTQFPKPDNIQKTAKAFKFDNTEQYVEDQFSVDVRYSLIIDCDVSEDSDFLRKFLLRANFGFAIPKKRHLLFFVTEIDVPEPYQLYWKVLNIGTEAERINQIRGQITPDEGRHERKEQSSFEGAHFVECYAVKDGVCVARASIDVPIAK